MRRGNAVIINTDNASRSPSFEVSNIPSKAQPDYTPNCVIITFRTTFEQVWREGTIILPPANTPPAPNIPQINLRIHTNTHQFIFAGPTQVFDSGIHLHIANNLSAPKTTCPVNEMNISVFATDSEERAIRGEL